MHKTASMNYWQNLKESITTLLIRAGSYLSFILMFSLSIKKNKFKFCRESMRIEMTETKKKKHTSDTIFNAQLFDVNTDISNVH